MSTPSMPRSTKVMARLYVVAVLAFLFAPLVVVVLFSFHSAPRMSFPFEGFSLRWYDQVLHDQLVIDAMRRSAIAAVLTGLMTAVLGLTASLALVGARTRVRATTMVAAMVPLTFPTLLYAIGLAITYHFFGVGYSLRATIAGHVIVALPFVFLIIGASLDRFRFSLLEAAFDLGASPWLAFRKVTLPLILPAVLGATVLAMALSADEFVVAFFTAGQEKTLPLLLYARINQGLDPSLNAIGTILLVATTSLAWVSAARTSKENQ